MIQLGPAVPILRMFDIGNAREFYCGFLGFKVDWEHRFSPEAPLYMQISRSGLTLHISEHHGDCSPGAAVRVDCTDVEALHSQISAKGYGYNRPSIETPPWGGREMTVNDPFHNRVVFVQRPATPAST